MCNHGVDYSLVKKDVNIVKEIEKAIEIENTFQREEFVLCDCKGEIIRRIYKTLIVEYCNRCNYHKRIERK